MRTIGIRDLKANLSRTLRDVQRGEHFLVTDRGRVVAELRAPGGGLAQATPAQLAIARLAAEGVLRVAERPVPTWGATGLSVPEGTAQQLIDAEREES